MRIARLAAILLLAACNDGGDGSGLDSGDPPIPRGRGDCGETDPVMDDLTIQIGEPKEYETSNGVQCLSTISITATPSDDDGDLHDYRLSAWFDSTVDGRVLREGQELRIGGSLGEDCEVFTAPARTMDVGIAGGGTSSPAFETETEFGVVVEDAAGNGTNGGDLQVVTIVTPPAADPADCQ